MQHSQWLTWLVQQVDATNGDTFAKKSIEELQKNFGDYVSGGVESTEWGWTREKKEHMKWDDDHVG